MHGLVQVSDLGTEPRTLLAKLLRALRLAPDGRIGKLEGYLLKALFLQVVFKETPSRRRRAPRDLSGCV
jgi:hypothetical protein